MSQPILGFKPLVVHPDTPAAAVTNVGCSISWKDVGNWVIDFIVSAPPEVLCLPVPAMPARADDLWQRTCFELFLKGPDSEAYYELNLSPSREWAAYAFTGYRDGRTDLTLSPPRIVTASQFHSPELQFDGKAGLAAPARFVLTASLEDARLPAGWDWLLGLSAVIEETDGTKSYWALAHPPGKPDFHHPDCFALELPAAG